MGITSCPFTASDPWAFFALAQSTPRGHTALTEWAHGSGSLSNVWYSSALSPLYTADQYSGFITYRSLAPARTSFYPFSPFFIHQLQFVVSPTPPLPIPHSLVGKPNAALRWVSSFFPFVNVDTTLFLPPPLWAVFNPIGGAPLASSVRPPWIQARTLRNHRVI